LDHEELVFEFAAKDLAEWGRSLRGRFAGYIHWNRPAKSPAQLFDRSTVEHETQLEARTDGFISTPRWMRFPPIRETAPRLIVKSGGQPHCAHMRAPVSTRLSAENKLDLLRSLDEFRFWNSLDDRRRCQRCHKSITGRQVEIIPARSPEATRLQCPTEGCPSTPGEWTYADPVRAAEQMNDLSSLASQPRTLTPRYA
jgi:hypothetical protein